jgi:hypothetical protein
VGKAIYAIDAFPDDAQLWRIDWIGGVAYNASVPSEPLIDVCLARLPKGETNPLSARSRSSETKFVAKIGVGLLPFISTASVWQKGRPVATDCAAYRRQLTIDTKSCRTEMLGDLTANYNGIPRSYYRFGASWPHVRETLLVIQEQDGDPFAVMMPTTEIIRFYYAPSTRLAQAPPRAERDSQARNRSWSASQQITIQELTRFGFPSPEQSHVAHGSGRTWLCRGIFRVSITPPTLCTRVQSQRLFHGSDRQPVLPS